MLNSGDVVHVELGSPAGREAGFLHPTIVVTAQAILDATPSVVHIVPLTSTLRGYATEIEVDANGGSGLAVPSAAQCQHVRSVSPTRLGAPIGNVGPLILAQLREMLSVIFDLPQ
ncbi:MAG: type II toxin-antitoxin system PemK/MazF family toxin [Ilumatobacteraceae bacterium]|nr:type II toxin-antitoxin system PemK/MazF family toxin [Ilumatobacteraceae bacterium]